MKKTAMRFLSVLLSLSFVTVLDGNGYLSSVDCLTEVLRTKLGK